MRIHHEPMTNSTTIRQRAMCVAFLSAVIPLCLAATPPMGTVFSEQFDSANSNWDKSTSGEGDFQVANGRLEFSADGGSADVAFYIQNQAEFNFDASWTFSTAFAINEGMTSNQKVEAVLGMQFGSFNPTYNPFLGVVEDMNGFYVTVGRDSISYAPSSWLSISSKGSDYGRWYFNKRARRAPTSMTISYNAAKDTLTLSAGSSKTVIKRVHSVIAAAGFTGQPRLYVAATAQGVTGSRVITFDNTEFRVAQ